MKLKRENQGALAPDDGGRAAKSCPGVNKSGDFLYLELYMLFLSLSFLLASVAAYFYVGKHNVLEGIYRIISSPSMLVTDYFALGGLCATLLNAALCGFITNLIIFLTRPARSATTFAAYMLVVAHCFYGLNFVNMWPPFIGVLIFSLVKRQKFSENLNIALFSTALAPFVSELLFRYASDGTRLTLLGAFLSLLFGIIAGFSVPALIPGTAKMHRGYNMYKAGLALGILGIFVYNFMYTSFGKDAPDGVLIENAEYYALPYAYRGFMNAFFILLFALTILFAFILNSRSFRGYKALYKSTGYGVDFLDKFGVGVCLINVGVLGLCILAYLNLVFILPELFPILPEGVGFTGATAGVVFAALTFSIDGQQPRTVAPIAVGYSLLFMCVVIFSVSTGNEIPWTLSTQSYINGLAFSTGLCPFAGKYGKRVGVLAGFLSAIICTATAEMHGSLMLYNGGFTAGLTALALLPVLDFYKVRERFDDDVC